MASPARFERATFRLGGGCSIQLSYGRIFNAVILPKKYVCVNQKQDTFFILLSIYCQQYCIERRKNMEQENTYVDLDDLLFEDELWEPSSR